MNLYPLTDKNAVAFFASEWIEREVEKNGATKIFIPAGNTPIGLYQVWEQNRPMYLDKVELFQIDEVISGPQSGMFKSFFEQYLPTYATNIRWIGEQMDYADVAVLGLGVNGHIAFHEPGLPEDFTMGCVKLNDITCKNLDAGENAWGHSYGLGAFLKCKKILMIVLGESKQEILAKLLAGDPEVPAARLLNHPGFEIICDNEAYGDLAQTA
jgi:glucosamine-6-phosphate deaminase